MTYTPSITYSFRLCFIVKVILSTAGMCSLRLWDCRNSCYNHHRSVWRLTVRGWSVASWKHNLQYQSCNVWIWNLNHYNGFFDHLFNIYLSHLSLVRDSSAVRRHYIFLLEPWDVRELYIWKTADLLLQLWVSTFPRFVVIGFYFLSETLI